MKNKMKGSNTQRMLPQLRERKILTYSELTPKSSNNLIISSESTRDELDTSKRLKPLINAPKLKFNITSFDDEDKLKDEDFLKNISDTEHSFYLTKIGDIYNFLNEIHLVRYIQDFILDGFESIEDILEIQEDYFKENNKFNKQQQNKILSQIKLIQKNKPFLNSSKLPKRKELSFNDTKPLVDKTDMSVGCDIKIKENVQRCWVCLKQLGNNNENTKTYTNGIITKNVVFCSEKCKGMFEKQIYLECYNCKIKYDKSYGDYIYDNLHFHSTKCLDSYLANSYKTKETNGMNIVESNSLNESDDDVYDPMEDF